MDIFFLTSLLLILTTPWFLLGLFSALADAGVGYIDEWLLGRLNRENNPAIDAPGRLVLISGFFGYVTSFLALLYILFFANVSIFFVPISSFLQALAAGVLEVIWLIPYFYALNRSGAISTTPLFQTVPIFSLAFGLLFFQEVPMFLHVIATFVIITGAALLNYDPAKQRVDMHSLLLMLLSSAIISISFFLFKDAALGGNIAMSILANGLGMGVMSALIWVAWTPYRQQFNEFIRSADWKLLGLQLGNESLYTIGAVAHQFALVLGPSVMVVSTLSAFNPLFTLLIGIGLTSLGLSSEKDVLKTGSWSLKVAGICAIALGTLLIALTSS